LFEEGISLMKFTRSVGAVAAVLALTALSACGSEGSAGTAGSETCTPKYSFPTISEGKLTIAAPDAPPFYMHNQNAGIDYEFISTFVEDACLEPVWTMIPAPAAIESVSSGRADLAVGGWYANEKRGMVVNQTEASYLGAPTIFSHASFDEVDDLKGKTIGTVSGYAWNEELRTLLGADKVKEYQSADECLADLALSRIEAALLGSVDAPYLVKVKKDLEGIHSNVMKPNPAITTSVEPSRPNYPHTKGNDDMTKALNQAIAEHHANGEFARILEKYGADPKLADTDR
jgi:polar amino acid transport system substrate-binding protein